MAPYHTVIGNTALCITANLAAKVRVGSDSVIRRCQSECPVCPEADITNKIAPAVNPSRGLSDRLYVGFDGLGHPKGALSAQTASETGAAIHCSAEGTQ
jgi:hypothetical protein